MADCCVLQNNGGAGSGAAGSMPFGSAVLGSALGICGATPITANQIKVNIQGDIGIPNPCDPNDPTNKGTWQLIPLNPGICVRLIQKVEFIEPDCIIITFDGPLCGGEPYLIKSSIAQLGCDTAAFTGIGVSPSAQESDVRSDDGFIRDIANPQLPKDALMSGAFLALGTYEITDTGDLAQDGGVSSLRKRIFRRVSTTVDQFFHLPGYGTDLEVKTLLRPDRLVRLQEKLRVQILREPEVSAASVSISRVVGAPNTITVSIRAQTASGQPVDLAVPISLP